MNKAAESHNTASQILALEIISELLASNQLKDVSQKLTEQLKELTSAQTVILISHNSTGVAHEILSACPLRRAVIFTPEELDLFCILNDFKPIPVLTCDLEEGHVLKKIFKREKIESIIKFDLNVAGSLIGTLLLLNLHYLERTEEIVDTLALFSNVIALAIKNAQAHEKIIKQTDELKRFNENLEILIQERTRNLEKANRQLQTEIEEHQKDEKKISLLLSEKELLLKEVHHRIKNNMTTIKGLLALQIAAEKNENACNSLKDAESRVQSMILLYEKLYCTDNYRELSAKDYLNPLAHEIIAGFPENKKITLDIMVQDCILNVKYLTPIGIILNEILTNMMKHAFREKPSGKITIDIRMETGFLAILIADDGRGIPDTIDFEHSSGFGMKLVRMLVNQIGGEISLNRSNGTEFNIRLEL